MKRYSRGFLPAASILVATLLLFGTIGAQEPATQIELIFDASGSI